MLFNHPSGQTWIIRGSRISAVSKDEVPLAESPEPGGSEIADSKDDLTELVKFFNYHAADPPAFFRAAQIGRALGISASNAGILVQSVFPVYPVQRKGYPADKIYAYLDEFAKEDEE